MITSDVKKGDEFFPIHQELITLARKIDAFNGYDLDEESITTEILLYIQTLLKLHQVSLVQFIIIQTLALLEVDFSKLEKDKLAHAKDIYDMLQIKGGLDYIPRERTFQGRLLEHASETKTLITQMLKTKKTLVKICLSEELFYISTSVTKVQEQEVVLYLKKDYVNLTLSSNGQAELFFHSYFWTTYAKMLQSVFPQLLHCSEIQRMIPLSLKPKQVLEKIKKHPFGEKEYKQFVIAFGSINSSKNYSMMIQCIQASMFVAQITSNKDSLYWIEKFLIQLLGYYDTNCRDNAVILLNSLYDGTSWQLHSAFNPVVRCIGQHFKVNLTIKIGNFNCLQQHIYLGISAPSPLSFSNEQILTWHKIDERNIVSTNDIDTEIQINFGKFWKCGFYDWRLMEITTDGLFQKVILTKPPVLNNFPLRRVPQRPEETSAYEEANIADQESLIAQGRYIVQPSGIRDQTFHEVQIDLQIPAENSQNKLKHRGTFADVQKALPIYAQSGVSVLYLMGVLERDNLIVKGSAKESFYTEKGSIPMVRRENAFALAVTSRQTPCEMLGGKDAFKSLIASANQHQIKIIIDCLARISSTRHHRKFRNLLLQYLDEEGKRHICYGTDGHQIKYEDTAMLNYRKIEAWDYLIDDVITFVSEMGTDGIHLDNGQSWPQIFEPDLEELMRLDVDGYPAYTPDEIMDAEIVIRNENYGYWQTNTMETYANPFFIKLCKNLWTKFPNFMILGECWGGFKCEHRQIILARSGVIPRLFKLPQVISSVFGTNLHRDGRITKLEKKESAVAIHNWYEESHLQVPQGTILIQSSTAHSWPYPAYLFGKATWAAVDILYFMPDIPITFNNEINGEIFRLGQIGSVHQAELQDLKNSGIKKSSSQVRLALEQSSDEDKENFSQQNNLPRIRSGHNLAAIADQPKSNEEVTAKEDKFRQEVGQDFGFDLSKIKSHYEHRRFLRQEKMVLRYGQMCPMSAYNIEENLLQDLLTFARYSLMETAIISINLRDSEQEFYIDMQELQKLYSQTFQDNTVIVVSILLPSKEQSQNQQEYFFLREFMSGKHFQTLIPYSSSIKIITVCPDEKYTFQLALKNSIERTQEKLSKNEDISGDQISLLLLDSLQYKGSDAAYFAGIITSIQQNFINKKQCSFLDLVLKIGKLTSDKKLFATLLALCKNVSQSNSKAAKDCKVLLEQNQLGPIVFCTPEIGRWSTVGGLGVMVDELSLGLAKLGQEVVVISPYYDRNRQGKTGYLSQDPSGINYVDNITVQLDQPYTLGVHEGKVGNVRVVFLHHAEIFPIPYHEFNAAMTIRQIAIFSKSCLEYCCKRQIIPSICVTNDWFTGFIPAYAKIGAFGLTFKGTTFLHILHNLMEDYEGRIYPEPRDGFLQNIHQLPKDWLIDPSWNKNIINPSRTALMLSDQWATVSVSYREDLLKSSPLSAILKQKQQPFAYPNGIPIADRLQKLDAASPNHLAAKRQIQLKYFNFKELDDSIPLFAFVGRITSQKGVSLILDIIEELLMKYQYKLQFLIAGPANMRDQYSANCAHRLRHLKLRFPHCVWAAPEEFFSDGSLINRGADFGLMPSLFEPGGIVQHEFFVGETPVIAYKTGGLKDSVIEFQWDSETGCGFTFESYRKEDFIHACQRAIGTFQNKTKYAKLRSNAFQSTMSGEKVSQAWLAEFYRLRQKVYFDYDKFMGHKIQPWSEQKSVNVFDQMFGSQVNKLYALDDMDFGASDQNLKKKIPQVFSEFDKIQRERTSVTLKLHNRGPRHKSVKICCSFDNWDKRHQMQFDPYSNQWFVTLQLQKGEHYYKFVIDEKDWVLNQEERQSKDKKGNINNYIVI